MKTSMLVAVMVGFMGLFGGQTIQHPTVSLILTIIGFVGVMVACIMSVQQLSKKTRR